MIGTLLDPVLSIVSDNPTRIGLGVSMIAVAFYYRRLIGIAVVAQSAIAYMVFGFVVIGMLVIVGIIPTINVSLALDYGRQLFDLVWGLRPMLPF